jgi:hypothetical protein
MPIKGRTSESGYANPYAIKSDGVPALEVRAKEYWVFPYAHFINARFNPSRDLVILFATHQVIVSGRNLKTLHEALVGLSLQMIELTDKLGVQPKDDDTVIDAIVIQVHQE